jgi:hypothetical protein
MKRDELEELHYIETVAKWMIPDVSFYEETPVKSSN